MAASDEPQPRDADATVLSGVPIYLRHDRAPVAAIGILDGHVHAAGPLEHVLATLPPNPRQLTFDRGALLPAFVDAHQHAFLDAVDQPTADLRLHAHDLPSLLAQVRHHATVDAALNAALNAALDDAPWLRLHGYLPSELREQRSPTAAELDPVVSDRPVHLLSRTYHESVVNSAGLDALGIGRTTPDPVGGQIVRDRSGRPTGVLIETASFAAEARSRRPLDTSWADRLSAHAQRLLALGITRIADAAVPAAIADRVVTLCREAGVDVVPLLVDDRISEPALQAGSTAKVLIDGGERSHLCYTPRQLRTGLLSALAAPLRARSRTDLAMAKAILRSDRFRRGTDGTWNHGTWQYDTDSLRALMRRAADAGSALAIHAIGNGALLTVLAAREADPVLAQAVPMRIEHAMVVDPGLIGRLADARLTVVTQPGFLPAMGRSLTLVPLAPPLQLMPYRAMLRAGVALAFSSDHPAADLDPWHWVAAAVTRRDDTGRTVLPDQAITVSQALDAATRGAAAVLGEAPGVHSGPIGGSLERGERADLIWADADPHQTAPESLAAIRTLTTWRAGRLRACL